MRNYPVILFGVGGVGRALLRQIVALRGFHAAEYGVNLSIMAVCDSNGAIVALDGALEDALLHEIIELKESGGALVRHPLGGPQGDSYSIVDIAGRAGAVVVDCTASDETISGLLFALDRGYRVVLANKRPLTGAQGVYDLLATAGRSANEAGATRHLGRVRWESTVGAAIPVNSMLARLAASGDEVLRIQGAFSGTLGYVMSALQDGPKLSDVVAEAYRLGYTEPDPRDDLSGMDVARKALILARGLGWRMELNDVSVESLYPESMSSLPVQEFLAGLSAVDDEMGERVAAASANHEALRYSATVGDGRCRVGLVNAPIDSPMGRLTGTDNLVEFATRWYNPTPLVMQGRGAGPETTAAGVLADMIELAFT